MLVAGALFAATGIFAKLLASTLTGAEISLYRSLLTLLLMGVLLGVRGGSLRTRFWRGHLLRGVSGTISLIGYFYAMTKLPLATAVMLNYTSPLFLAVLSTVLLRDQFRFSLAAAIALGLVGVVMLLRPTFGGDQAVAGLIGLASGFFAALAYINVKKLGDAGEPEWRVVFYFALVATLGSAAFQGAVDQGFHPIGASQWPIVLAMGVAATGAQLAMTRAYHSGKALVVGAFAYSTVIFASLAGIVWFDEVLPPIAWWGMAIIIVSGILAKRAARPNTTTAPIIEN